MLNFVNKLIISSASLLLLPIMKTSSNEIVIPNYNYSDVLPEYKTEIITPYEKPEFGHVRNFDYDMNKYENTEYAKLNVPLFKGNAYGNLYYRITMTNINNESFVIVEDVHKEGDYAFRGQFGVSAIFNFDDMGEKSEILISIRTDENVKTPSELKFYLSSPNTVAVKNQYVRVFSRAKLDDSGMHNFEDRLEFINLPKDLYLPYYFKFYSDNMYVIANTFYKNSRFGAAYLYFSDSENLFKKAFETSEMFPGCRGAKISYTNNNPAENYLNLYFSRAFYVDLETFMSSNVETDFKNAVLSRDLFFPINKYTEYKTVDFHLYINNIGRSKTDICYDFRATFGDKHIQSTLDVSREIPIDEFSIKMKEVIL